MTTEQIARRLIWLAMRDGIDAMPEIIAALDRTPHSAAACGAQQSRKPGTVTFPTPAQAAACCVDTCGVTAADGGLSHA